MTGLDDLLPAEEKVQVVLGDLPLDFRAMAVVSNLFPHLGGDPSPLGGQRAVGGSAVVDVVRRAVGPVGVGRPRGAGTRRPVGISRPRGRGSSRRWRRVGTSPGTDARGGRLVIVSLTPDGLHTIEKLFPRFNAEEVSVTDHLRPDQQEALASMLRSMLRRVGTDAAG